jgi:hypothetical protein
VFRLVRSVLVAPAILAAVVAAYAGLAPDDAGEAPSSQTVLEYTPQTTPRGLAMGIIDHLDGRTVTSVAVTGQGGTAAQVTTDDPAVSSILVVVAESTRGPWQCGSDDGFAPVSCQSDGPLREVVRHAPGGTAPTFVGRANDDFRGDVLIELHGDSASPEVEALVQALVDDLDLGLFTTQQRNTRGRDLHVVPLRFESTLEAVLP